MKLNYLILIFSSLLSIALITFSFLYKINKRYQKKYYIFIQILTSLPYLWILLWFFIERGGFLHIN